MRGMGEAGEVNCRRGVVTWKVKHFSSLLQSVNSYYDSPDFYFQDRRFSLRLYPNCTSFSSPKDCVSLSLFYYEYLRTRIELRYSLGIQATNGKIQVCYKSIIHFGEEDTGWGGRAFIPRSELLRRTDQFLPQDVLTVTATLQEIGADEEDTKDVSIQTEAGHKVEDVSIQTDVEHKVDVSIQTEDNARNVGKVEDQEKSGGEKGVLHDIKKLWVSGDNCDVVLKVKDEKFKAHRNILAVRTPVLGAMFQHDTAEAASGEVTIDDCEPAVFEQLLHYVYTGAPRELNAENAAALYVVADKYLVSEVKSLCVRFMKEELCLDTFCDYVTLSLMFNESELLEMAVDFFSRNMIHVVMTVQWQRFTSEHSTWGNEILIRALKLIEGRNGEKTS